MVFSLVSSDKEVAQILDLQGRNHKSVLDESVKNREGFLTVQHDPAILWRMNQAFPSVIAKDSGGKVVGYCLFEPQSYRYEIPILEPFFELLDGLSWQGKNLKEWEWFVMGQVCVDEKHRGQGVFDGMYAFLRQSYAPRYDFVVTEVASTNLRSLRAHARVGFEVLHSYKETLTGESWEVIIWDWRGYFEE